MNIKVGDYVRREEDREIIGEWEGNEARKVVEVDGRWVKVDGVNREMYIMNLKLTYSAKTSDDLHGKLFQTHAGEPLIFLKERDKVRIKHTSKMLGEGSHWHIDKVNDLLRIGDWKFRTNYGGEAEGALAMHSVALTGDFSTLGTTTSRMNTSEDSGGSCNYYKAEIVNPTSEDNFNDYKGNATYTAECNDIIEALDMTFAESNMFKEIWRTAAARTLGKEKAGHTAKRGAEKIAFFAERNLIANS